MAKTNNYVLGRGKIYFDRFANGTRVSEKGELFLGNCPTLSTTSSTDSLDHYSSTGGQRILDASADLQTNRTGSFTSDNISANNLALFFSGIVTAVTQASATAVVNTKKLYKGRRYQLGVTASNPSGVRNISSVVVATTGGSPVTLNASNYVVDAVGGSIEINDDATLTDGTDHTITFNVAASTRDQVLSKNESIYGAIRFKADNAEGLDKDYYLPYVKLSPNGDYNLIGDEWAVIGFNLSILKLDDVTESVYIDGVPVTS